MRTRDSSGKAVAVALVLMTMMLGGCGLTLTEPELSPEDVVTRFYRWYIGYPGNPLADQEYRESPYLADSFIEEVDEVVRGDFRADPILLAQDIPERFTVEEAEVSRGRAMVHVDFYWPGNPTPASRSVSLEKMGGTWKITGITVVDPG